jgi:hypothetical protein
VLAAAGCSNPPAITPPAAAAAADAVPAPSNIAEPVRAGGQTAVGTVLEKLDAASYTYVHVDTGTEKIWAAAGRFDVAVGDRVRVSLDMPMENFHSETLERDFPLIYFAEGIEKEGAPGRAPAGPAVVAPVPGHGATSVADVWAKRSALAGTEVTVRGTIVKFNGGIMGRNWIHIQDGTGRAEDGTDDLTVTTEAPARVGDVITAKGILAVDRDFGAGYSYKAILEGATLR